MFWIRFSANLDLNKCWNCNKEEARSKGDCTHISYSFLSWAKCILAPQIECPYHGHSARFDALSKLE